MSDTLTHNDVFHTNHELISGPRLRDDRSSVLGFDRDALAGDCAVDRTPYCQDGNHWAHLTAAAGHITATNPAQRFRIDLEIWHTTCIRARLEQLELRWLAIAVMAGYRL